ncbi:hypothetical protein Q3G72_024239 [Acer saccharum]|nr:hypothetical protein Q3G72_024239 [Acer saccharum]
MEDGLLHPSVIMKIQGQLPFNFYRIIFRPKRQALMTTETSGAASTSNSTSNLHQPRQGNAFVRSPSKGHDQNVAFTHLLYPVTIMAVLKTATAPLQRVNFLIQSQNEMIKLGRLSHAYKGIGDCFTRTVRNEGFISLWRGNTASVLHFASGMVQRTMMDSFRINSAFCRKKENDGLEEWFARNFATMALFGGTSILLVYHLEYARTRMANDIKIIQVLMVSTKGSLMASLMSTGKPLNQMQSWATTVILTGGVGICCDLATYPIDTVHRRMMMRSGEAINYRNTLLKIANVSPEKSRSGGGGGGVGEGGDQQASSVSIGWKNWPEH